MRKNFITGLALLFFGSFAIAQNYMKSDFIKVQENNPNGTLKFASFKNTAGISVQEAPQLLKEALKLNGQNQLVILKNETDTFGAQHLKYKQVYNGVEVAYGSFVVHAKNGMVTSINGEFNPIEINQSVQSLKSPEQIFKLGLAHLGNSYNQIPEQYADKTPINKLYILPKGVSNAATDRYAYAFPMVSMDDRELQKIFLDALTGEVLRKESITFHHQTQKTVFNAEQIAFLEQLKQKQQAANNFTNWTFDQGNADTRYSGSQLIDTKPTDEGFVLQDENRHLATLNFGADYLNVVFMFIFGGSLEALVGMASDFVDDDNNWTSEEHHTNKADAALEAHWGFSNIYDFFKEEYDRDGYDGADSDVYAFMHTTFFGSPSNAAWMSLGDLLPGETAGFMFVGDGDYNQTTGTGNFDVLASMDVIAHEYSHGVTNAASGLVYERESGALNEGFADIWGAAIEAKKAPDKERWVMGEDFVLINPAGIRSLENPKLFNQPNTYMGDLWEDASDACEPGTDNDNCGVHTNSGVLNYWFYLISDGGSGTNDFEYEYSVDGIGIEAASDLIYSVQLNYVQYQSKFADVRDYTIQEAEVMFGEDSEEVIAVQKAWCAVGVSSGEECDFMGTHELAKQDFNIYPNPTQGILNVQSAKSLNDATYQVTNTAGQVVLQGKVQNQKIDVNLLSKGVYILNLKTKEGNQQIKFIKK